jgi:deoxyhypusine synthase
MSLGANWLRNLSNPLSWGIKKYMFEMLQERYSRNEDIITRVSDTIMSEKDYQAFGQLIVDVYEKGFSTALEQQKEQFEKMGLDVNITSPISPEKKDNSPKIFPD